MSMIVPIASGEKAAAAREARSLLRVMTCGSVDDGKSTLLGRMLYETENVPSDQAASLESDSRTFGRRGTGLDFALLVDGLAAEREQGITIDVAYRYFATSRRKFIIADTPGHEQFTRNMVTGASVSDAAILLVDARKGLLTQTHRHCQIAYLLGIQDIVVAVNKMDLAAFDAAAFQRVESDVSALARRLEGIRITCIPVVAPEGDNIATRSARMPWYEGPTLLGFLEELEVDSNIAEKPMRLPVQLVTHPSSDFRGYAGTVASGTISLGDEVIVLPSAKMTSIARIVTFDAEPEMARAGEAVTVVLKDQIDVSRGMVIAAPKDRPVVADQIAAYVIWLGDEPMLPGRSYVIKSASQTASASITALKYKLAIETGEHIAGRTLELNEIGVCNLSFSEPLVFDPYTQIKPLGRFILVDRDTNETVAAGLIRFGLRRAENVHWQALAIDKKARADALLQRPRCIWFTGLSGSGKSTIASLLEKRLHGLGKHTYVLDGDNVRHGLNRDLGFADADRVENIRRVAEVAKLMVDAGLITVVSFISPFRSEREMARSLFAEGEFVEVYVDTPLEVCEQRDIKGLYRKARAGQLKNFTGIDSPYEAPEQPDVRLTASDASTIEDLVDQLVRIIL